MPLAPSFFARSTLEVAPALLGAILVHDLPEGRITGRVVETEAYTQDDPACHGFGVKNEVSGEIAAHRRGRVLFEGPGTSYVYLVYGMYWLLNVVTEPKGACGAVLIRAVEPLEGIDQMRQRRKARRPRDLTNGPGKLTQAFAVDQTFNGRMLTEPPLFFEEGEVENDVIATSPRIGISKAKERPWRFFIEGNPYVSPN